MHNQSIAGTEPVYTENFAQTRFSGLTSAEVEERAARGLQNKIKHANAKQLEEIFAENLFSVFNAIVVLIVGTLAFFYFRTGDERLPLDAIGVLSVAVLNATLAIYQEIRAKNALEKVNLLLKRNVSVVRDGKVREIDREEIVVGDLLLLERGDQIAVDGRITEANHLEIDESLLTGESVPVEKTADDSVLSGSFCLSGNGFYVAEKVGGDSFAAQITGTARQFKLFLSPLQQLLNKIVEILFVTSIALVALELIIGRNQTDSEADFVRRVSTIVISLVPHGLVLMSSVTFAVGVYRISQLGAIVQKLNAIEAFSNVKIVCTDKTGTLTQNKLSIRRVSRIDDLNFSQTEVERFLGIYGELSSDKNATLRTLDCFAPLLGDFLRAGASVKLVGEIPFSSATKMSAVEIEIDGEPRIFVLGGFDVLLDKIGIPGARGRAERIAREKNLEVYRNLLFGRALPGASLDRIRADLNSLKIEPFAIVSISDEIRPDVLEAIKLFQLHGIELKILSGDAPESVRAVAHEIGWQISAEKIVTGGELDRLDDKDFVRTARDKTIFARLNPEHKLRLIKTFRQARIYTAMIGDGVNDLPAIKEADLGIAMEEGSTITKEIADIVLLKNRFALLPQIFDEGNRIVNTTNSIAKLFLTKNFLVIYLALAALFFGWAFPLTPRRVALINVFSITLPAFIIALKNRDASRTRHFTLDLFSFVAISGLVICAAGFAAQFAAEKYFSASDENVQMTMLSVMTLAAIANFFVVAGRGKESWDKSYLLYGALIVALYAFLTQTRLDVFPLDLLRMFYEINYLSADFWLLVLIIAFPAAASLFLIQKIRQVFIKK